MTDDVFGVFLGVTDGVFHGDVTWKVGLPGDFVVTDLYFFCRCSIRNILRHLCNNIKAIYQNI